MIETNSSILSGGISDVNENWNITGSILNEKLLRLYIPISGEAVVRIGKKDFGMHPGNVYLFSGSTVNMQRYTGNFEHFWLHILPQSLHLRYLLIWKFVIHIWPAGKIAYTEELVESMRKFATQRKAFINANPYKHTGSPVFFANEAYQFKLHSLISYLIGDLLENQNLHVSPKEQNTLERLRPAIDYMDENYINSPPLDAVSEKNFMTPSHFHKVFVKCFSLSPYRYMLLKRLSDAKELLLGSDLSIKEIAKRTGYANNFYFSKVFKDEFGISPKKFREIGS